MKLQDYTTEELRAELKRRSTRVLQILGGIVMSLMKEWIFAYICGLMILIECTAIIIVIKTAIYYTFN